MLVTDGGGGQNLSSLAAVRAVARAGYEPDVTRSFPGPSLAGASRRSSRVIDVPPAHDPGYADAIRGLIRTGGYVDVLVASDAALHALDAPGAALADKAELGRRAVAAGFQPIPSRTFRSGTAMVDAAADLDYPVVAKVARKHSAVFPGAVRLDTPADVARFAGATEPFIVQPHLGDTVRAVVGVTSGGRFLAVGHQRHDRLWPPDAGDGTWIETIEPDPQLEDQVLAVVADHAGIIQAEVVGPHLLDLNPRVYGSLSLAVAAGINLPAIHLAAATGARSGGPHRARVGVRMRWLEGDLRHLAALVREGRMSTTVAVRAFDPGSADVHALVDAGDPAPLVARARHVLGRLTT